MNYYSYLDRKNRIARRKYLENEKYARWAEEAHQQTMRDLDDTRHEHEWAAYCKEHEGDR